MYICAFGNGGQINKCSQCNGQPRWLSRMCVGLTIRSHVQSLLGPATFFSGD